MEEMIYSTDNLNLPVVIRRQINSPKIRIRKVGEDVVLSPVFYTAHSLRGIAVKDDKLTLEKHLEFKREDKAREDAVGAAGE